MLSHARLYATSWTIARRPFCRPFVDLFAGYYCKYPDSREFSPQGLRKYLVHKHQIQFLLFIISMGSVDSLFVLSGHTCMHAKSLQSCPTLCDPMNCSHQPPLLMGFSRQEYWSGLPCLPPGDLLNSQGLNPLVSYVSSIGRWVHH